MKRVIFFLVMFIVIISCQGEPGPVGPTGLKGDTGTDGTNGTDGTSVVTSSTYYEFYPVGNPYTKFISSISVSKITSGKQIVQSYVHDGGNEWKVLPMSMNSSGVDYDYEVDIGDGYIQFRMTADGTVVVPDFGFGLQVKVVIIEFD